LPPAGQTFAVRLAMTGDGSIQALSVALVWDADIVEPVGVEGGELLTAQGGGGLVLSPQPGTVDVGLLGIRQLGISGEGVLASVTFRSLGSGFPDIAAGEIRARSATNEKIDLGDALVQDVPADGAPPSVTTLHPNVPNPFNPFTTIAFDLAVPGRVTVKIYGIDGRLVTTLVDESYAPGRYSEVWNGRDDSGRTVASGTYVARMVAPDRTETRRMMLLK
jgi:hypothetical protein